MMREFCELIREEEIPEDTLPVTPVHRLNRGKQVEVVELYSPRHKKSISIKKAAEFPKITIFFEKRVSESVIKRILVDFLRYREEKLITGNEKLLTRAIRSGGLVRYAKKLQAEIDKVDSL